MVNLKLSSYKEKLFMSKGSGKIRKNKGILIYHSLEKMQYNPILRQAK